MHLLYRVYVDYLHTYTHTHMYIYIYTKIYAYTYTCMYIYMYMCIYIYIFLYLIEFRVYLIDWNADITNEWRVNLGERQECKDYFLVIHVWRNIMCSRSLPLRAVLPTGARTEMATWLQLLAVAFPIFWKWTSTLLAPFDYICMESCCGFYLTSLQLRWFCLATFPFWTHRCCCTGLSYGKVQLEFKGMFSAQASSQALKMKLSTEVSVGCEMIYLSGFIVDLVFGSLFFWRSWRVQYRTIPSQFI